MSVVISSSTSNSKSSSSTSCNNSFAAHIRTSSCRNLQQQPSFLHQSWSFWRTRLLVRKVGLSSYLAQMKRGHMGVSQSGDPIQSPKSGAPILKIPRKNTPMYRNSHISCTFCYGLLCIKLCLVLIMRWVYIWWLSEIKIMVHISITMSGSVTTFRC